MTVMPRTLKYLRLPKRTCDFVSCHKTLRLVDQLPCHGCQAMFCRRHGRYEQHACAYLVSGKLKEKFTQQLKASLVPIRAVKLERI